MQAMKPCIKCQKYTTWNEITISFKILLFEVWWITLPPLAMYNTVVLLESWFEADFDKIGYEITVLALKLEHLELQRWFQQSKHITEIPMMWATNSCGQMLEKVILKWNSNFIRMSSTWRYGLIQVVYVISPNLDF